MWTEVEEGNGVHPGAMKLATVAFYGFALGLLAVGLRELLTGFEENRCTMTYMFEYPEYRVSVQPVSPKKLPYTDSTG